jgi:hypothetical protein
VTAVSLIGQGIALISQIPLIKRRDHIAGCCLRRPGEV